MLFPNEFSWEKAEEVLVNLSHLAKSDAEKFWVSYHLERSESLKKPWSTYHLERGERLKNFWST